MSQSRPSGEAAASVVEPLPADLPGALARPGAHPGDPSASEGVDWRQTHISHVFLTGETVVKLRKSVALSFVSFATRAERNRDCLREVSLNRRLAPDVYLGVAPLLPGDGGFTVGPVSEALSDASLEHAVVMRRLPEGRDALSLLERGELLPTHVDAAARAVARFHAEVGLGVPAPFDTQTWRERTLAPVRDSLRALGALGLEAPSAAAVKDFEERLHASSEALEDAFEQRRCSGRAVDGHGDLHLDHLWFEGGPGAPLFIDCLEFDEGLRHIDAASEVAFLAMDLRYRGHPELGERFLRDYAAERDDFDLYSVVDFFVSYRALVRAKVAGIAAADPGIEAAQRSAAASSASAHFELAHDALEPAEDAALILMCGTVGAGKSSVAHALADETGAVVVSSDRTRKALAGLAPSDRSTGEHLYAREQVERVYGALLERAAAVASSGRKVVLDATYGLRVRRDCVRAWAAARGLHCDLVEVECGAQVARERLAAREAAGSDASDAGPELLDASRRAFETPSEWPAEHHHTLDTSAPSWRDGVRELAARLA